MGIFGTILSKIFPSNHPAIAAANGASPSSGGPSAAAAGAGTGSAAAATAAAPPVDVVAVLNQMAQQRAEKLNWRTSIVDLMKLLGLDSSLNSRKELAKELHYAGDANDSASMNIWLQKQVMQKLAENGGKVPEELKH
jgi:dihydroorotase-like cyclic amidohydrolase